jgi:hypothetical protein
MKLDLRINPDATREHAIYDPSDKKIIWKDNGSPCRLDGIYKSRSLE